VAKMDFDEEYEEEPSYVPSNLIDPYYIDPYFSDPYNILP